MSLHFAHSHAVDPFGAGAGYILTRVQNCDDSNHQHGDGCSYSCTLESGWICCVDEDASNSSSHCCYTEPSFVREVDSVLAFSQRSSSSLGSVAAMIAADGGVVVQWCPLVVQSCSASDWNTGQVAPAGTGTCECWNTSM